MDLYSGTSDERSNAEADVRDMLEAFCKNGFDGDQEKAALALGRPASEISEMLDGLSEVDDKLEMKMRSIAKERGFRIE